MSNNTSEIIPYDTDFVKKYKTKQQKRGAFRGLVLLSPFKKCEKNLWKSYTFRLWPATLPKVPLVMGVIFALFRLYKWTQIAQSVANDIK